MTEKPTFLTHKEKGIRVTAAREKLASGAREKADAAQLEFTALEMLKNLMSRDDSDDSMDSAEAELLNELRRIEQENQANALEWRARGLEKRARQEPLFWKTWNPIIDQRTLSLIAYRLGEKYPRLENQDKKLRVFNRIVFNAILRAYGLDDTTRANRLAANKRYLMDSSDYDEAKKTNMNFMHDELKQNIDLLGLLRELTEFYPHSIYSLWIDALKSPICFVRKEPKSEMDTIAFVDEQYRRFFPKSFFNSPSRYIEKKKNITKERTGEFANTPYQLLSFPYDSTKVKCFTVHDLDGGETLPVVSKRVSLTGNRYAKEEFDILNKLVAAGLPAPKPIAWVHDRGNMYFIMKRIVGKSLLDLTDEDIITLASLSESDVPRMRQKIEDAVSEAHTRFLQAGFVHKDWDERNIMISFNKETKEPIITPIDWETL